MAGDDDKKKLDRRDVLLGVSTVPALGQERALGKPRDPASSPVGGDWPDVPDTSEAAWREALASLQAGHEQLVAVVRSLPEWRLRERMAAGVDAPAGSGITVASMLKSLADHDGYHSGQVSLLKRLAGAARAGGKISSELPA